MPTNLYDFQTLARFAASGILNCLIAGIAFALLAWAFTNLLRPQGASTRFAVWFLALVAVALFPWAGLLSVPSAPVVGAAKITFPESMASYLFVAWLIGSLIGLAHVAHGLYRLRKLRLTCESIDPDRLDPILGASLADFQSHRRVTLCTSDSVRVPAAIGYIRPLVVIPTWSIAEIPASELNAILLHELAHLRRYDDWTNLAQKVVKSVFFFHPAVWFIESRLTLEREMACDDAVLAANFSPRAYAESLVGLAERSCLRRGVRLAQAAVSHVQQLKLRIVEILSKDKDHQGSGRVWKPAIALMSLAGLLSVYGVARAPHMVAFTSATSQMASANFNGNLGSSHEDVQLQPVNVSFTDHSRPVFSSIAKAPHARLRMTHRITPMPHRLVAQSYLPVQELNSVIPPPILALSNFPSELLAASEPVLVVFRSEQLGSNGPIVLQVTVFAFTRAQQHSLAGGSPKKI